MIRYVAYKIIRLWRHQGSSSLVEYSNNHLWRSVSNTNLRSALYINRESEFNDYIHIVRVIRGETSWPEITS